MADHPLTKYGKRWGIEAGFRDIKDMRFGMGLSSIHVSRPDRRDSLLLISALATAVLSLLGAAGERIGYDRWLKANHCCPTKDPRKNNFLEAPVVS